MIKINSLLLLSQFNEKLSFLKSHIEQTKQTGSILPKSPFSKLILLHQNQIEKIYDIRSEKPDELSLQKEAINSDSSDRASRKQSKIQFQKRKELKGQLKEIIDSLPLNQVSRDKIYFTKIKENNKSYLVGIHRFNKDWKSAVFFKNNSDFFKFDPSKDTDIYFTTVTANNYMAFHNKILKKKRRSQLLESLLKTSSDSSKYITIKNKKTSDIDFYYLSQWEKTNLYLISQFKNSVFISSVFSAKMKYTWVLVLTFVLFCLSLFAFWLNLSSLISAYAFLKSAVISFSNNRLFPLSQSKNPLLYFYNNRSAILNKKEPLAEEQDKPEDTTFQGLIKSEINQLKSRYPNLVVTEDFHSNVKIFGIKKFLKTVIHELLLNALESMGAKEKQQILITLKEENNNMVFSIRDYGSGLPDTKKAFQMYYSTKSQLGVGLNLVQSIVSANGGKAELTSLKEGGAKATVSLPLKVFLTQQK